MARVSLRTSFGELRPLGAEEGPLLQSLLERELEYAEISFGLPPGAADAESQYLAGLDMVDEQQKWLLGLVEGGDLVLVLDVLDGWPSDEDMTIGLLLVDGRRRRRQWGGEVVRRLEETARALGRSRLRVSCHVAENRNATPFWEGNGFVEERRFVRTETDGGERTVVLLTKAVAP